MLKSLAGCEMKCMRPIFLSVYQSKANLDVKILFSKGTHLSDPEIRKVP